MKKLLCFIGSLFKKLSIIITTQTWRFIGFVFTWLVPIYLLGEKIVLVKEVSVGVKLSFAGLIVLAFCIIAFHKKLGEKIITIIPHNTWQFIIKIICIVIYKIISYGTILLILIYSTIFLKTILDWFINALISIGIGLIFYIVHWSIVFGSKQRQERKAMIIRYILSNKELYGVVGQTTSSEIEYLGGLSFSELKSMIQTKENISIKVLLKRLNKIGA